MMPGAMSLSRAHRLGHDPLFIAALGQLIGVEGVPDVFRPQEVQGKKFFGGSGGQLSILLRCQGRHPPAGLAGNGDTGTAGGQ